MKRIFLILLPLFIKCYGMHNHPVLTEHDYEEYAKNLLKSFEQFGKKETYRAAIEKYMLDTIQDCSSKDKDMLKAATMIMDPARMRKQIPNPNSPDEWICIIFAEQMQKLFNHMMCQELGKQIRTSIKNYQQKLDEYSNKEQMFYKRLAVARNYAQIILTILNAK